VKLRDLLILMIPAAALIAGCGGETPETVTIAGIEFLDIPAGTFTMGSPEDEAGHRRDETAHSVTIPKPFLLAKTEVNNALWAEVMGDSTAAARPGELPRHEISWADAIEFCNALSRRHDRAPVYVFEDNRVRRDPAADGFRLPTEAEWEYAGRAGTTTRFPSGDCLDATTVNYRAHITDGDCPTGETRGETVPVGSLPANRWGLHEMLGNVEEWCWDWLHPYPEEPVIDAGGPPERNNFKVIRGGSCQSKAERCRSAARGGTFRANRMLLVGMRLALDKPAE